MMRLFKIFKTDMRMMRRDAVTGACFTGLCVIVLLFAGYCKAMASQADIAGFSFADNMLIVLAGCAPFEFRPGIVFVPPLGWLLLFASVLYASANYPSRSLRGLGSHLLIEGGSRVGWFAAKLLATFCADMVLIVAVAIVVTFWTVGFGQDVSLVAHRELLCYMGIADPGMSLSSISIGMFCAGSVIALVALTTIQLFLSIVFGPALAFVCSIIQLLVASYFESPFLIANLLMSARWEEMTMDGVSLSLGMVFASGTAVGFAVLAVAFISRVDIIERRPGHVY